MNGFYPGEEVLFQFDRWETEAQGQLSNVSGSDIKASRAGNGT